MPGPYPAVNIGDINNLDAVFTPGLHLLETSGEDIVSAFINRHIVMPRLNVIDFVCNRIDPAVFITAHILLNGFADSPIKSTLGLPPSAFWPSGRMSTAGQLYVRSEYHDTLRTSAPGTWLSCNIACSWAIVFQPGKYGACSRSSMPGRWPWIVSGQPLTAGGIGLAKCAPLSSSTRI